MALNGIDISRYQKDIDLSKVPCDFVIVKATEGADYVSPEYDAQYKAAKKAGKKLGVYHFASGNHTGEKEADYFLSQVKDVIGEAILCLDWESDALKKGVSYANAFLDRVYEKTGVKPFIYMSKSVCRDYDWSSVVNAGYPLWCAQYANNNITGYQDNPWTDSKGMGAFKKMVIYQYSSHGRLDGYSGNLDLDIFYGSAEGWDKYAGKSESSSKPEEKPEQKPATNKKNTITVDGLWGVDTTKKAQKVFGTTVDGKVSNQLSTYKSSNPGLLSESWEWQSKKSGCSPLIKAIQKWCGATQDGLIGPDTIKKMQKKLRCGADGKFDKPSPAIKAFQKWLNKQ